MNTKDMAEQGQTVPRKATYAWGKKVPKHCMTTELWILEAQNQGEDMKDNYKQVIELLLDQNRLKIASNKRK